MQDDPCVAERLNTQNCRKLVKFKKINEMVRPNGKQLAKHPRKDILTVVLENCQKSAVKVEKRISPHFVKLSTIFCPKLQEFLWNIFQLIFYNFLYQLSRFVFSVDGWPLTISFRHFRNFLEIYQFPKISIRSLRNS